MIEKKLKILNEEGMHARPAGVLAKMAGTFTSVIEIATASKTVNAKSIMSVMGLGLTKDAEITVRANGADESAALEQITTLINNKFQL